MGLLKQVCLNNIEGIQNCLKTENVNTKDSGGNTALHLAAEKGLLPIAKLLVENGADVDIRNESPGWTPLHFASYEGHIELVKFFVNETKATPNIKDNQGDTPETWALEWENYKCAMVISEAIKKWKEKPAPPLDSPSSSDEEDDDDDDDEEMSHWVLPLPTVIPKDLSKANIPQMKEFSHQNNMDHCDIEKNDQKDKSPSTQNNSSNVPPKASDSNTKSDKRSSTSNTIDINSNPEPHIQTDSSKDTPPSTEKTLNENTSSNEKVNKKEIDYEKLPEPPLDLIEPLLPSPPSPPLPPPPPPLPSTSEPKDQRQRRRRKVIEDSRPDDKVEKSSNKSKCNPKELEPICENGAIKKSSSKKSSSSPNVRRKNSSDSVPDIDKQLRYISKDKAFSRDLRGSAADIISMTNSSKSKTIFEHESRSGDLARISRVKEDLLKKLDYLIEEERRQLENDLSKKFEELDRMKRRHREEEDRIEFEISLLTEKLDNLVIPPVFSRAQCFSPPSIEKDITCVGCSRICIPPAKIFQCEEGDILCQECKENKGMPHCPECGIQILKGLSRNKALEKLARKHYD